MESKRLVGWCVTIAIWAVAGLGCEQNNPGGNPRAPASPAGIEPPLVLDNESRFLACVLDSGVVGPSISRLRSQELVIVDLAHECGDLIHVPSSAGALVVASRTNGVFTFVVAGHSNATLIQEARIEECGAIVRRVHDFGIRDLVKDMGWSPDGEIAAIHLTRIPDSSTVLALLFGDQEQAVITDAIIRPGPVVWLSDRTLGTVLEEPEGSARVVRATVELGGHLTLETLSNQGADANVHAAHRGRLLYTVGTQLYTDGQLLHSGGDIYDRVIPCGSVIVVREADEVHALSETGEVIASATLDRDIFLGPYSERMQAIVAVRMGGQRLLRLVDPRSLETKETIEIRLD